MNNPNLQNFVLLETEIEHTGGTRTGPLAAFSEVFRGTEYFHVRRVYRDNGGMWRATGQGISCRLDQRANMIAALEAWLHIDRQGKPAKRNGKAGSIDVTSPARAGEGGPAPSL